jgi:hypothetical protein
LKNLSEKLLWKISLKNPFENSFWKIFLDFPEKYSWAFQRTIS